MRFYLILALMIGCTGTNRLIPIEASASSSGGNSGGIETTTTTVTVLEQTTTTVTSNVTSSSSLNIDPDDADGGDADAGVPFTCYCIGDVKYCLCELNSQWTECGPPQIPIQNPCP